MALAIASKLSRVLARQWPLVKVCRMLVCDRATHEGSDAAPHDNPSKGSGGQEESMAPGKEVSLCCSSLRVDAIASAGLDIARKKVWESNLDGLLLLNGNRVKKKSVQVCEGDIVELDTILKEQKKGNDTADTSDKQSVVKSSEPGSLVKRGRVVVKEIGNRTRSGGYHLTLVRYKHFKIFRRNYYSVHYS